MELEKEKEEFKLKKDETDRWINFLSALYANPFANADGRKAFMESIKPTNTEQEIPKYETDVELLRRLKEGQEGG